MKIVLTLAFAVFTTVGCIGSVKAQSMTAYETKMLEIETERLELGKQLAAYQMCAVRKQLVAFTFIESCLLEYGVKLPKPAPVQPQSSSNSSATSNSIR